MIAAPPAHATFEAGHMILSPGKFVRLWAAMGFGGGYEAEWIIDALGNFKQVCLRLRDMAGRVGEVLHIQDEFWVGLKGL